MQGDSYTDEAGRRWTIREGARGGTARRSAGQGVPVDRVALWFESGDDRRTVLAPVDWRERGPAVLARLFADAIPWPND